MTYRVMYKRFNQVANGGQGGMLLVEDDIEASRFEIVDGTLVFYRQVPGSEQEQDLVPFMAIPPTFWVSVEPATPPANIIT